MTAFRFVLALAVGAVCMTPPASAILIEEIGSGTHVGGFPGKDDGTNLTIRVPQPGGKEKIVSYPRAKVKVLFQVNANTLEGLSPENPTAYRAYADELARQEEDPEAVYIAKRLYLIAAHLAPDKLGGNCLVSMSKLAGVKQAEARKYRALALMLDPKMSPDLLKEDGGKPAVSSSIRPDKKNLDDFRKLLQPYCSGNYKDLTSAITTAKQGGLDNVFTSAHMNRDQFVKWCDAALCKDCPGNKRLGLPAGTWVCPTCKGVGVVVNGFKRDVCKTCNGAKVIPCPKCHGTRVFDRPADNVRVVLRAELWTLGSDDDDSDEKGEAGSKSWSAILQSGSPGPVRPLSLDTVVPEFDPHKCVYRNGKWVEK